MLTTDFNAICKFRKNLKPKVGNAYKTTDPEVTPALEHLANLTRLLEREFSNYKNVPLSFEYSRGAGNFPTILHTSILPPGQKTSNGIYVVICFDKYGRGALVGANKSVTTPQNLETIVRKLPKIELNIDVDGGNANTKYNNTFANPKEFYYKLNDDAE